MHYTQWALHQTQTIYFLYIFSTSDRLLVYQMCYCYRKLEILCILYVWEAEFGLSRPLTASHALSDPVSSHLIGSERESEAVRGRERPNLASHRLGLSQFVMWSVWANQKRARPLTHTASHAHGLSDLWGRGSPIGLSRTAGDAVRSSAKCIASAGRGATGPGESPICEADRPLTHSGRCNAFSREISQIAPRIGLSAGVRERPIGLTDRTLKSKSCDLSVRPICEADLWGRGSPKSDRTLPCEAMRLAVKSVR